ncbi:hypothetical protein INR49_017283, partial [Caranx melampygus]
VKLPGVLGLRKWPNPPTVGCFLCCTLGWFLFKCGCCKDRKAFSALRWCFFHGVPTKRGSAGAYSASTSLLWQTDGIAI